MKLRTLFLFLVALVLVTLLAVIGYLVLLVTIAYTVSGISLVRVPLAGFLLELLLFLQALEVSETWIGVGTGVLIAALWLLLKRVLSSLSGSRHEYLPEYHLDAGDDWDDTDYPDDSDPLNDLSEKWENSKQRS